VSALGRYVTWAPADDRGPGPLPLPRLTGAAWLAWRRNRTVYRIGAVLLAVAVLWAVWERRQLVSGVHTYARACLAVPRACHPTPGPHGPNPPPTPAAPHLLFDSATTVLRLVPVVVGAFLGGPLFAQDLEGGTHRLAWTQSIGRRQWVGAKLAVSAGATVLGTGVLSAAASWCLLACWLGQRGTGATGHAWNSLTDWDNWDCFAVTGPVAVAHALLALLLGATAGLLVRRTLPAVALAGALSQGALLGLDRLRSHLLPLTYEHASATGSMLLPRDAWLIGNGYLRDDGAHLSSRTCGFARAEDMAHCFARLGVTGQYTSDHRMSQFLPLQGVETAICLAVTAALAAFCLWHVRRITAR
jgi:hypothetical protein